MKATNLVSDLMVVAAFRYCLGRTSYIVSDGADMVRAVWPTLEPNTRNLIRRELTEAEISDDNARDGGDTDYRPLGMDCDRDIWLELKAWIEKQK